MGSKELERAVQETVMLIHVWGRTSSACFWWGHRNHALGERLNGIQEVSGSIPLISTNQTGKVRRYFDSEKWQKRKVSVTFSLF